MALRPTQSSIFSQVSAGIRRNLLSLVRAQEQVASGKRILRPSDDGVGTAISMSLDRQLGAVNSSLTSVHAMQPVLATSTTELEEGSILLTEARGLILQALNGTMTENDRAAIGLQIEQIADTLLEIANTRFGDRHLFGGTETANPPFVKGAPGRQGFVQYIGDENQQRIRIGRGNSVDVNIPGDQIFAGDQFESLGFSGLSGMQAGTSASSGEGYTQVTLRTDNVTGINVAGLAMGTSGGTTILGEHVLEINAVDGTIQLGNGPTKQIPTPLPDNFTLLDGDGSVAVIDLTNWNGSFVTTTLVGEGSFSTDGSNFQSFDRFSNDVQIYEESTGNVLHVDGASITRAGEELVSFDGATNIFDTLFGIADELTNSSGDNFSEVQDRIGLRYNEMIAGQERLLTGLGRLGSRYQRLNSTESRLQELSVQLEGLQSTVSDVDIASAVLELQEAEQTLQLTQATGARLMQQSLLNYLG